MDRKTEKERLLERLLRGGYIRSDRVLAAMRDVPRELFVPEELADAAYDDTPLPIGWGQTISAPHMVAMMCELLDIREGDTILEVGGGCGYHAAVMSKLAGSGGRVFSVELVPELVSVAVKNLERAGICGVEMVQGDGGEGVRGMTFDRISVAAASPGVPPPLKETLKEGGKMVVPVGKYGYQELLLLKKEKGVMKRETHGGVVFVPLRGRYGIP